MTLRSRSIRWIFSFSILRGTARSHDAQVLFEFMDRSPQFELVPPEGMDSKEYSLNMRHGDWDLMT